jgi:EAL domain-containing protein (putative c-di-GMP-specific phosphodiesterase class I)
MASPAVAPGGGSDVLPNIWHTGSPAGRPPRGADAPVPAADPSLESALANVELAYHYQPKIDLHNGRVSGVEALLRWIKPDGRVILPGDFMPAAEASGLMQTILLSLLERLLADFAAIQAVQPGLTLSFNLAAEDFGSDAVMATLRRQVEGSAIDPALFQVELTETALFEGSEQVRRQVRLLLDLGMSLAMDDFGTGYSTIDVLSQWPFTVVKLHQGLIQRLPGCPRSSAIVHGCIQMAHRLGIKVVAEGIESQTVYDFLVKAGCSEGQGFWMGRPMPVEALLIFLGEEQNLGGGAIGSIHLAQMQHLEERRRLIELVFSRLSVHPGSLPPLMRPANGVGHSLEHWHASNSAAFSEGRAFQALELSHVKYRTLAHTVLDAVEYGATRDEVLRLLHLLTAQSAEVLALLQFVELDALQTQTLSKAPANPESFTS